MIDLNSEINRHPARRVWFESLDRHLVESIDRWPAVAGCVAWLSQQSAIDVLASKRSALVVQKEHWITDDRRLAESGIGGLSWRDFGFPSAKDIGIACVGSTAEGAGLMHHKFFLMGLGPGRWRAVWFGSYNPTNRGRRNLDAAILSTDPDIVRDFAAELRSVLELAEPRQWLAPGLDPHWRRARR